MIDYNKIFPLSQRHCLSCAPLVDGIVMVDEFRNSVFVSAGLGYGTAAALLLVYGIPLRVARTEN